MDTLFRILDINFLFCRYFDPKDTRFYTYCVFASIGVKLKSLDVSKWWKAPYSSGFKAQNLLCGCQLAVPFQFWGAT